MSLSIEIQIFVSKESFHLAFSKLISIVVIISFSFSKIFDEISMFFLISLLKIYSSYLHNDFTPLIIPLKYSSYSG